MGEETKKRQGEEAKPRKAITQGEAKQSKAKPYEKNATLLSSERAESIYKTKYKT